MVKRLQRNYDSDQQETQQDEQQQHDSSAEGGWLPLFPGFEDNPLSRSNPRLFQSNAHTVEDTCDHSIEDVRDEMGNLDGETVSPLLF